MELVDLTGTISERMWSYGKPFNRFSRKKIADINSNGYEAYEFSIVSHMGTHIDTYAHFKQNAHNINDITLNTLYGNGVIIPVTAASSHTEISVKDIEPFMAEIHSNDIVLFYTGWDKKWESSSYVQQTPFLSNELARWLVRKQVKLIGTDTALCSDPRIGVEILPNDVELSDTIFLEAGIPFINGLVNLDKIINRSFNFLALPLKIEDAEGVPVRAIAMCND